MTNLIKMLLEFFIREIDAELLKTVLQSVHEINYNFDNR